VPDCVPERATASDLAAALISDGIEGAHILLPAGNLARPELRRELEGAGAWVDEVVAYRTVRPDEIDTAALDALRTGTVDVVALASPSAIRNLVDMLEGDVACLQRAALACIGPSTAAAVQDLGLSPTVVAARHTLDGLAEAIVDCSRERTYGPA
jgi:uroporphyrinogen-III synthase